jgi:hypothetical protein
MIPFLWPWAVSVDHWKLGPERKRNVFSPSPGTPSASLVTHPRAGEVDKIHRESHNGSFRFFFFNKVQLPNNQQTPSIVTRTKIIDVCNYNMGLQFEWETAGIYAEVQYKLFIS